MPPEIKICGLTNRDDALLALDCGADYVGFVTYRESPRGISSSDLRRLLEGLERPARAVGVFVNESRADVEKVAADCGLYAVQVHGYEEAAEFVDMPLPLWRAVRGTNEGWIPLPETWRADRYVVDAAVPGLYGGSGVEADWNAAAELAGSRPLMLAGGLTPDNVAEAIRVVRPMGVDVSTGVEAEPGKKDPVKVKAFVEQAKAAPMDWRPPVP